VLPTAAIVKTKALSHLAGLHSDCGVFAWIVISPPAENVDAYGPLFENVATALERILNYVIEKFATALAGMEFFARENAAQHVPDRVFRN
jgi:hypothetical protein